MTRGLSDKPRYTAMFYSDKIVVRSQYGDSVIPWDGKKFEWAKRSIISILGDDTIIVAPSQMWAEEMETKVDDIEYPPSPPKN